MRKRAGKKVEWGYIKKIDILETYLTEITVDFGGERKRVRLKTFEHLRPLIDILLYLL